MPFHTIVGWYRLAETTGVDDLLFRNWAFLHSRPPVRFVREPKSSPLGWIKSWGERHSNTGSGIEEQETNGS